MKSNNGLFVKKYKKSMLGEMVDVSAIISLVGAVWSLISPAVKMGIDEKIKEKNELAKHVNVSLYNGTDQVAQFKINGVSFIVAGGETGQIPDTLEDEWKKVQKEISPTFIMSNSSEELTCPPLILTGNSIKYSLKPFTMSIGDKVETKVICTPTADF